MNDQAAALSTGYLRDYEEKSKRKVDGPVKTIDTACWTKVYDT